VGLARNRLIRHRLPSLQNRCKRSLSRIPPDSPRIPLHRLPSLQNRCKRSLSRIPPFSPPLGQALVERMEKELGRRLRRGKAGRPRKEQADPAPASFFAESV